VLSCLCQFTLIFSLILLIFTYILTRCPLMCPAYSNTQAPRTCSPYLLHHSRSALYLCPSLCWSLPQRALARVWSHSTPETGILQEQSPSLVCFKRSICDGLCMLCCVLLTPLLLRFVSANTCKREHERSHHNRKHRRIVQQFDASCVVSSLGCLHSDYYTCQPAGQSNDRSEYYCVWWYVLSCHTVFACVRCAGDCVKVSLLCYCCLLTHTHMHIAPPPHIHMTCTLARVHCCVTL